MNETRFWWVRHAPVVDNGGRVYGGGEIDADVSNLALFAGLARRLPRNATFVASALARTRQTLAAVRAAGRDDIPAEPEQDPRLNEQSLGEWHGRPTAEVFPGGWPWPGFWMLDAHTQPPGGESFHEVCVRVAAATDDLAARHGAGDIVVAAHGGVIKAALSNALGAAPAAALAFSVANCSITRIDRLSGKDASVAWRVAGVNQTPA